MSKLDKVFEVLENWQSRSSRNKNGEWDDKYTISGGNNSTLNGGRPLSPMRSLDELSDAEIEQIRREWGGKAAVDVDFSRQALPTKPKRIMLDGSPISQHNLDRIQLQGRPQPGRDLESFNDVPMPDYDYRGGRIDNPNVRRGDDRVLPPPSTHDINNYGTELPGKIGDYSLGNPPGISLDDTSLIGNPTSGPMANPRGFGEGRFPDNGLPNTDDFYRALDIGKQKSRMQQGVDIESQIAGMNRVDYGQNPVNFDMSSSQEVNDKAREAILRARKKLTDLF